MKSVHTLTLMKRLALVLLLPGLGGLIVSAMISVHCLATMPQMPDLEAGRVVPRAIHGTTVYQTPQEDRRLNILEYASAGVASLGLAFSMVFLAKWGAAQARSVDEEHDLADHNL